MNTGICFIPLISNKLRIVFFDCLPYLLNGFAKTFFRKRFALKHKIFAFWQFDYIKSIRDFPRIVHCNLYTLYVFRRSCLDVLFRKP